jgi:predicted secreted protein
MRTYRIVCAVALAALLGGELTTSAMTASTARAAETSKASIQLAPGERTVIELSENPSTGYVWRFDMQRSANVAIVRIADQGFSPAASAGPRIGAGQPSLVD